MKISLNISEFNITSGLKIQIHYCYGKGDKLLAMYYESIIEESLETRAYRLPLTFLHYAAIFFRFLHFSLPPFTLDMFKRTYYYSDSFSVPRVLQFLCCIQQLNMYWPLRWQHLLHYVINLQCFTKLAVFILHIHCRLNFKFHFGMIVLRFF